MSRCSRDPKTGSCEWLPNVQESLGALRREAPYTDRHARDQAESMTRRTGQSPPPVTTTSGLHFPTAPVEIRMHLPHRGQHLHSACHPESNRGVSVPHLCPLDPCFNAKYHHSNLGCLVATVQLHLGIETMPGYPTRTCNTTTDSRKSRN